MSGTIKIACHVHSDWSYDGKWPLPNLAAAFPERGYRVVMMTEHDRGFSEARRLEHREACAKTSFESLLLVPGIEYSDASNTVHVLVWGPVPFLGEGVPTGELLREVSRFGGIAVLAHPSRRQAWKVYDRAWATHLLGVEVWNRKTDGWAPSKTAPAVLKGTSLLEFVGLDFHDRNQFFPLAMEISLAGALSENALLGELRSCRGRARAFGFAVSCFRRIPSRLALNALERCRRTAAQTTKPFRQKSLTVGPQARSTP
jgi:hypothetical protein